MTCLLILAVSFCWACVGVGLAGLFAMRRE